MAVKPLFTMDYIQNLFEDFVEERINKEIAILMRMGEEFVNKARTNGSYTDRTGNLRNSVGYVLMKNGIVIQKEIGLPQVAELFPEISDKFPNGIVLIGFAGMQYAEAVEAKGFDVITGSIPSTSEQMSMWSQFLS